MLSSRRTKVLTRAAHAGRRVATAINKTSLRRFLVGRAYGVSLFFRALLRNRALLTAAGMICLIAAAPGFGTPLFFYQVDTLHFSKQFIGNLELIHAAFGLGAAWFYQRACRRLPLKTL